MGLRDRLSASTLRMINAIREGGAAPEDDGAKEAALLNSYKQQAVESARNAATLRGTKPTMTDYYIAAEQLGQENAALMREQGIQWGARVYSDMSGLQVNGYDINNAHIEVPGSKENKGSMQYNAVQGARLAARQQNRPVTRLDVLQTLKTLQTGGDAAQAIITGIESEEYFMDLSETHEIGPLFGTFAEIENQTRFSGTVFGDCNIHPAGTTFAHHADGATHTGCTFAGLEKGNHIKFTGTFGENNIITDVNEGTIEFDGIRAANGAQSPAKITMEGENKVANLVIRNSQLELDTGAAHIVRMEAIRSTLINPNFTGSTIDMMSTTDGTTIVNPNLTDTNLKEVVFANTTFKGADFSKADISGIQFTEKTKLINCTFSPEQIPQLRTAGIENTIMENVRVGNVPITNTQASLNMAEQVTNLVPTIREALQAKGPEVGTTTPPPPRVAQAKEGAVDLRSYYSAMSANGGRPNA